MHLWLHFCVARDVHVHPYLCLGIHLHFMTQKEEKKKKIHLHTNTILTNLISPNLILLDHIFNILCINLLTV